MRLAVIATLCYLTVSTAHAASNNAAVERERQQTYDNFKRQLSPSEQRKLTASQRLWVTWREQDCRFSERGEMQGSMFDFLYYRCLSRRAEECFQMLLDMQQHWQK